MHALLLALAPLLGAQDPTPEELARAYAGESGIRYTATYVRAYTLARTRWVARGDVVIGADGTTRIDGQWTPEGATEPVRAVWYEDASGWTLVHPDAGTYSTGKERLAAGDDGHWFSRLALPAFDPDPYGEHSKPELGSFIRFEGGQCRIVSTREGSHARTDWYVATSDLMPRLAERYSKAAESETLVERLTLTKLEQGEASPEAPDLEGLRRVEVEVAAATAAEPDATKKHQSVTDLSTSLATLRAHFESQVGKPRLIGLFAPS